MSPDLSAACDGRLAPDARDLVVEERSWRTWKTTNYELQTTDSPQNRLHHVPGQHVLGWAGRLPALHHARAGEAGPRGARHLRAAVSAARRWRRAPQAAHVHAVGVPRRPRRARVRRRAAGVPAPVELLRVRVDARVARLAVLLVQRARLPEARRDRARVRAVRPRARQPDARLRHPRHEEADGQAGRRVAPPPARDRQGEQPARGEDARAPHSRARSGSRAACSRSSPTAST